MKLYVGITDYDWFKLHTSNESVDEVNFWRPSSTATFKALHWGEPFLFKLHSPRNFIVGGGFFTTRLGARVAARLADLRRTLRVKEVRESLDSSGL